MDAKTIAMRLGRIVEQLGAAAASADSSAPPAEGADEWGCRRLRRRLVDVTRTVDARTMGMLGARERDARPYGNCATYRVKRNCLMRQILSTPQPAATSAAHPPTHNPIGLQLWNLSTHMAAGPAD